MAQFLYQDIIVYRNKVAFIINSYRDKGFSVITQP